MPHPQQPAAPKTVWAYAYQIVPPQPEERLHAVRALLERARADAQLEAHTWEGRLVVERQVTHIMVVSDSPELDIDANRRLESALENLKAGFSVTAPLAVNDEGAAVEAAVGDVALTERPGARAAGNPIGATL